jgi:hypothetical protein
MKRNLIIVGALILCALLGYLVTQCSYPRVPEAPITRAPTGTDTLTWTPTATFTPTFTPTNTETSSPNTLTATASPSSTPTNAPTVTPTQTRIPTMVPGRSQLPTTGAAIPNYSGWVWMGLYLLLASWIVWGMPIKKQ